MILGVDVHAGYGAIDWARVAASGVRFMFARCTVGNDGKDARFDSYVRGARAHGIYVGAYLFAYCLPIHDQHPGRSPKEQARKFYSDAQGLGQRHGELPPVVDFEWPPHYERVKGTSQIVDTWAKWGVNAKFICDWMEECLDEVEQLWERTPIVYTYRDYMKQLGEHGRRETFARRPLWLADGSHLDKWLPPEGWEPRPLAPWARATFVQHGFDGSPIQIPGIPAVPVDRDCFMWSIEELRALAQVTSAETQPELPDADATQPVTVPTMREDPFGGTRIIHPTIDFPPRRYDRGPGNDDDPEAA